MRFLMDTDHISVLQRPLSREFIPLNTRMRQYSRSDFAVSIASLHEQLLGANAVIARARTPSGLVLPYARLWDVFDSFKTSTVVPFDDAASQELRRLMALRIRIGAMDLRIAATAKANGLVLLTRNSRDFGRVPGLTIEDWLS